MSEDKEHICENGKEGACDSEDSGSVVTDLLSSVMLILLMCFSVLYMYSNVKIKDLERRVASLERSSLGVSYFKNTPLSNLYRKNLTYDFTLIGSFATEVKK